MKIVVSLFSAYAFALAAACAATPAAALEFEYTYPPQHEIEARQIVPACPMGEGMWTTYYGAQAQNMAPAPAPMAAPAPQLNTVIHFASGTDKLSPMSAQHVRHLAHMLQSPAYRNMHIVISGYSDTAGRPADNERLSYHRALNVMHALINEGVPGGLLSAQGLGNENPVATNSTDEGRAQNRRVAFSIVNPDR